MHCRSVRKYKERKKRERPRALFQSGCWRMKSNHMATKFPISKHLVELSKYAKYTRDAFRLAELANDDEREVGEEKFNLHS